MAAETTLNDVVKGMHDWYAGDTKYPTAGSDDWNRYVLIINKLLEELAKAGPALRLRAFWEEREFGSASASTSVGEYDLDDDVAGLSDWVFLDQTDGNTLTYRVIDGKDRGKGGTHQKRAWISGTIPLQLNLSYVPTSADGATIRAGVYFIPDDLSAATDPVPIDNTAWIELKGAARLAFTDPSKEDKFPDLIGMANDEWQKLADANTTLPDNQPNAAPIAGYSDPSRGYGDDE